MRKTAVVAAVLVLTAWTRVARADEEAEWVAGHAAMPGTILVAPAADARASVLADALTRLGLTVRRVHLDDGKRAAPSAFTAGVRGTSFLTVALPAGMSVERGIALARELPGVAAVGPNHVLRPLWSPDDPGYKKYQQNFRQIRAEEAWEMSRGLGVTVAVIDSGYRVEGLTDSAAHLAPDADRYDFWGEDTDVTDYLGHGTHVANTIAEATDNALGVAGLAPQATLLPLKIFPDGEGNAFEADLLDALAWAVDHGAQVVNLSLGGAGYSEVTDGRFADATAAGLLLVCASGNDAKAAVDYPGAYDGCLAVGSVNQHANGGRASRSSFSNYGEKLGLVAPGEHIVQETWTPDSGPALYAAWGTSNAAPHVTATAALMIARGGVGDPAELRATLAATAQDMGAEGWDKQFGAGEVDAAAAVRAYGDAHGPVPEARFSVDRNVSGNALKVRVRGEESDGGDGGAVTSYAWDFGDGTTGEGPRVLHRYRSVGEFEITLVVTGESGATDAVSERIAVHGNRSAEKSGPCGIVPTADAAALLLAPLFALFLIRRRSRRPTA
jgi:serine protease